MKTLKLSIIIILSLSGISLHAQISDKLTIDLIDLRTEKSEKGYDNIGWKSDYTTQETGNPELPVYRVTYVLPVDAQVKEVNFTRKERKLLKQNVFINPVQEPIPTNYTQQIANTQPNSKVYESNDLYPNKLYEIGSDEFFQGYHIITLRIYPFVYIFLKALNRIKI